MMNRGRLEGGVFERKFILSPRVVSEVYINKHLYESTIQLFSAQSFPLLPNQKIKTGDQLFRLSLEMFLLKSCLHQYQFWFLTFRNR